MPPGERNILTDGKSLFNRSTNSCKNRRPLAGQEGKGGLYAKKLKKKKLRGEHWIYTYMIYLACIWAQPYFLGKPEANVKPWLSLRGGTGDHQAAGRRLKQKEHHWRAKWPGFQYWSRRNIDDNAWRKTRNKCLRCTAIRTHMRDRTPAIISTVCVNYMLGNNRLLFLN